jgi:hypothetical protein
MPTKKTVGQEVTKLLLGKTQYSYSEIAAKVCDRVEGAHTTPRTVASIATSLRAAGHKLPDRRSHSA